MADAAHKNNWASKQDVACKLCPVSAAITDLFSKGTVRPVRRDGSKEPEVVVASRPGLSLLLLLLPETL